MLYGWEGELNTRNASFPMTSSQVSSRAYLDFTSVQNWTPFYTASWKYTPATQQNMVFLTKLCKLRGNEMGWKEFFPNSAALLLVKTKFSTIDMKKEDGVRPDVKKKRLKNIRHPLQIIASQQAWAAPSETKAGQTSSSPRRRWDIAKEFLTVRVVRP